MQIRINRKSTSKWVIALVMLAPFIATGAPRSDASRTVQYRSNAFDLQSGAFLYSENHTEIWREGRHIASYVEYRDAAGAIMAVKEVNYRVSQQAPEYRLEDRRNGYLEGATQIAPGQYRFFRRDVADAEIRSEQVRLPAPMVVDAGFDYFVRNNFDALLAGRALVANFAVAPRLDYYSFSLQPLGTQTYRGRSVLKLQLGIHNAILRQFLDPVVLYYDIRERRLLEYVGLTNLNRPDGENYEARIVFPDTIPGH
ncbi:MAG: hypothetical protein KDK27_02720 [Leptospiraceae bacterium]|nr:hypothetical protein [Leptospiraceae bacterium]